MLKKRIPILLSLLLPLLAAVVLMNTLHSPAAHAAPMEDADPSRTRGGDGIINDNVAGRTFNASSNAAASSPAGSIAVNTTTDEFGTGTGCSLREAIQSANQDSDFDNCTRTGAAPYIVNVPTGTYTLVITGSVEDSNMRGDLDIIASMVISGAGAGSTIIDGNMTDRVFDVISNTVTFDSLTITHGKIISGNGTTGSGGGVRIRLGTTAVTITNSTVVSNTSSFGGGIRNYGSILTIINSSVSNNVSDAYSGGGIRSTSGSSVYIYSSLLDSNQATEGGGGIYGDGAVVTIVDSTISNNHTDDWGGGIFIDDNDVLTVTNSTISGNTATIGAGAISDNCNIPAMINITNSTISNNGTPTTWSGGGLDMCSSTANFKNSILAGNYNGTGPNNFLSAGGSIASHGYNLESGMDASFTATGDLQNTDPLILPLADNGGATWTHALVAGSPAIDHIPDGTNGCGTDYTTDQRNEPRPSPSSSSCDIGSYEKQPGFITINTTIDEFGTGADCSLREAIETANQDSDFGGCLRAGSAPYQIGVPAGTYTLTTTGANENANASGDLDILASMVISGAGTGSTIIDGNMTDRVFDVISNTATFNNLTITNGDAGGGDGGGLVVHTNTAATVTNSAFVSNTATFGGGIQVFSGTLTINNSVLFDNQAFENGGGISSRGILHIYDTVIDNNRAVVAGGGISNYSIGEVGTVIIESSSITNNHTDGWGGGILTNDDTTLTIMNSTISGNVAIGGAGAISDECTVPATISISNSTIVNNSTPTTWSGGGMDMCTSTATFKNSILAENYNGNGPSNFVGTAVSQGYNLESGTDAGFMATGDLQNSDPLILPLADNGGATWTHALGVGSPAIDHIPDGVNGCGTTYITDQRNELRPVGDGCDIGSYEKQLVNIFLPIIHK